MTLRGRKFSSCARMATSKAKTISVEMAFAVDRKAG
jgi:hypothetical protein